MRLVKGLFAVLVGQAQQGGPYFQHRSVQDGQRWRAMHFGDQVDQLN